jgi:hypothetical protein
MPTAIGRIGAIKRPDSGAILPALPLSSIAMLQLAQKRQQLIRIAVCTLLTLAGGTDQAAASDWTHGVYVWQRVHTPELLATLLQERSTFKEIRVLAAQSEGESTWVTLSPDWQVWQEIPVPLVPVLRLQGSKPLVSAAALVAQVLSVRDSWQQNLLHFDRVELDFDCAESQLPAYVALLRQLSNALGPYKVRLEVTALPSWLENPAFRDLLTIADRVTLQVHAVVAPREGIFDAAQAEQWIRRLDVLAVKPFAVALPAYGARLLLDGQQRVIGVEHEAALAMRGTTSVEVNSDPAAVQTLLQSLQKSPPQHLQQVQWFRLPLSSDERAWSITTLKAVRDGLPLAPRAELEKRSNTAGGMDLWVHSTGNVPSMLPAKITVDTGCFGEGVDQYEFRGDGFYTSSTQRLKPGSALIVGWLRCGNRGQASTARIANAPTREER